MIRLTVDGVELDAGQLEMHYQEDPYPAGSKYHLTIADADLVRVLMGRFGQPLERPLSATRSIALFNILRMYLSLNCGRRSPPLFWANTVDTISILGDSVAIIGTCSPHLGTQETESDSAERNAEKATPKAAATVSRDH